MWTLLLIACSGPATGVPDDSDTDPTDTDVLPTPGIAVLDALLAGETPLDEAVTAVAWGSEGGFPVRDGSAPTRFVFLQPSPGPWSIAGDFNDWVPAAMDCSAAFCTAEVTIDGDPAGLKYKFTRDGEYVADPIARSYTYDAFGEISYVRPPASDWRIDRWPDLQSPGLLPRTLRVFVPPHPGPYDVLYTHDGQNLFDPGAMFGTWDLQTPLGAMSDAPLVVGIDNTADRFDEYTHVPDIPPDLGLTGPIGGNADAYAALVHATIRPHIEAVYGSTGTDGVMGSSLGGLVSMHIAHRYPGQYDFVACLSGTLGWGRWADLGEAMETRWLTADPGGVIYLYSGGQTGPDGVCADPDGDGFPEDDPDSWDNYCETRQLADALAAAGRTWDADLFHWHTPDATHNEAAWAAVVEQPLGIFAGL